MGLKNLFSNIFKKQEETENKQEESINEGQSLEENQNLQQELNSENQQDIEKEQSLEEFELSDKNIKSDEPDKKENDNKEIEIEESIREEREILKEQEEINIYDLKENLKTDEKKTEILEDQEDIENIQSDELQLKEEKKGLFARLKEGLQKTSNSFTVKLDNLFKGYLKIDEDLYEEIEEILITSDISFKTTIKIVDTLRDNIKKKSINDINLVKPELKEVLNTILDNNSSKLELGEGQSVIVIVGVNGVGKTTSIGKLALKLKSQGKSVLLAAGDTFRAAAGEQLEIWSKRAGVDIVMHRQDGADPSAVIYDAIQKAKTKNIDVLICDTAGRLHNKKNLMNELSKIMRTIDKEHPNAKKEVLLVIDATTGQNALSQVKTFNEVVNLTGVILTKLDGTAKGGVVLSIIDEHSIPVKFIGVGEKVEDLQEFDSKSFVDALFDV